MVEMRLGRKQCIADSDIYPPASRFAMLIIWSMCNLMLNLKQQLQGKLRKLVVAM